jgi:uncharacterized protein YxjI
MSKHEEHHENIQGNPDAGRTGVRRYQFRQKMVSIGTDYWIENEQGEHVYKVDGKIGLHKVFHFEDTNGNRLVKITKRKLSMKETMEIAGPQGDQKAVVKKDFFSPLKEHFVVSVKNGPDLEIHGNILDHEYTIGSSSVKAAEISKKYFHVRDSYSVSIQPGQEDVILLAVVVCIDEMTHS